MFLRLKKLFGVSFVFVVLLFSFIVFVPVSEADTYDTFVDDAGVTWYIDALTSGSGSWTVPNNVFEVDILVVAGGGSGGCCNLGGGHYGGGGGAGGLIWIRNVTSIGGVDILSGNDISYVVGDGGIYDDGDCEGVPGEDSVFGNLTAIGGGFGGSLSSSGGDGGSGGGCGDLAVPNYGGDGVQPSQPGWSGMYGHGYGADNSTSTSDNGICGGGAGGKGTKTTRGAGMDMSESFGTDYGVNGMFCRGGGIRSGGSGPENSGYGGEADSPSGVGDGGSGIILLRWNLYYNITGTYPSQDEVVSNNISTINVTIENLLGNTFNWSIETSPDVGSNSSTGDTNGTKNCSVSGLMNGTTYTMFVNITDSEGNIANETITFRTFGTIEFWCYDENLLTELNFSLTIYNSHIYQNMSLVCGDGINIEELPYGPLVTFIAGSPGYQSRVYTYDIDEGANYNFSFYLSRLYNPNVRYTSVSISDDDEDAYVLLDCVPESIVQVEGYNDSLYGHWFPIPDDKWSVSGNNVTVDKSVLDENTATVRVTYYCDYDTLDYIIHVQDILNNPIDSALLTIERIIDEEYATIMSILTDGNGDGTLTLKPGVNYRIVISKNNYITRYETFLPTVNVRTKTYILTINVSDVNVTRWDEYISMSAILDVDEEEITVSYTDNWGDTNNVTIVLKEYFDGVFSVNSTLYGDDSSDYEDAFSVNISRAYRVTFYVDHGEFGVFQYSIDINSGNMSLADVDDVESLLIGMLGENSLGWINFIGVFMLMGGLFAFGEQSAGVSLLGTGFMFLFINIFIVGFVVTTLIPILFIILGVLVVWNDMRRIHAN